MHNKLYFETSNGALNVVRDEVGHKLPVEASVSVSGVDGAIVDGVSALIRATVKDYTNANPLTVVLVDVAGDPYVAAAGGSITPPATATRTSVADSATAVSLIASNTARKGLVITNDSSALLYVGLGTVDPTTTNYSFQLFPGQTWEMGTLFTGQLKGIWTNDPNDGAARITELTA